MDDIKKQFIDNGWVLIKNFFSREEIQKIEQGAKESIAKKISVDLLCNPLLQDLTVLNPRIIAIVKQLLGEDPTYIGDSSISYNDVVVSLHKDNPDRFNQNAPDWQSPYTVLRMGIYLQDYESFSGGLTLLDKSHNYISRWKGKVINVRTQPGDLVIWNLRTTHSGSAKLYKLFPRMDGNPYLNKYLPSFLFKPSVDERIALFLSYGKDDAHLDRYIRYLKTRVYAIARWRNMTITDEIRNKAEQRGLKLMDLTAQAKDIKDSEIHPDHREIDF